MKSIFPAMFNNLMRWLTAGVNVSTDYTAVGTFERGCLNVDRAVRLELKSCSGELDKPYDVNEELQKLVGCTIVRGCDFDPLCQRAVQLLQDQSDSASSSQQAPRPQDPCLFQDICNRVSPTTLKSLMAIQCKWQKEAFENQDGFKTSASFHPMLQEMLKAACASHSGPEFLGFVKFQSPVP